MGNEGKVLTLCSRTALILSLDASMKSHKLVLWYGTFSCSKNSVMPLQKHKLSFMVNNVSRSSVRFPCSVNFLKAWCQKLAFFFGQIEIPAQLISSLLRKRYWFILAWSLGSKYSPLECSSALLERLVHELIPFFGSTRETKHNADF